MAGVSSATVFRYLNDDRFATAYRRARRDVVEHVAARLQHDAGLAAKVLCDIASDAEAPSSARVAAAGRIIDFALRTHELSEIMQRIEALEQADRETLGLRAV